MSVEACYMAIPNGAGTGAVSENTGRKVLDVKPFNDFWLKNCINHHAASALQYYGFDKFSVILNESFEYGVNEKDGKIYPSLKAVEPLDRFLERFGITMEKMKRAQNLQHEIIRFIDGNMPVMVSIDYFYLKSNKVEYNKIHRIHYILVYGYDLRNGKYHAIEHKHDKTLFFYNLEFDTDEIELCYTNSLKLNLYEGNSIIAFKKTGKATPVGVTDHSKSYDISNLMKALLEMREWKAGAGDSKYYTEFLFQNAIRKNIFKYLLKLHGRDYTKLLDDIQNASRLIAGMILKCIYTPAVNAAGYDKFQTRVDHLIDLEKRLHAEVTGNV